MNTKQLACFIEVAESLNFTEASSNLFLSQPAVTYQIQSLEEELGVPLFIRSKKNVSLTTAGRNFYTDAKEIFSRMLIAKSKALNSGKNYTKKIAIGYSDTSFEKSFLPKVLRIFSSANPEVYIFLKKLGYKDLIAHLQSKKMDIIFTYTKTSLNKSDCVFLPLITSHFYAYAKKEIFPENLQTFSAEELNRHTVILPEDVNCPKEVQPLFNHLNNILTAPNVHYCDCVETAKLFAKSGLGIAILPDFDFTLDDEMYAVPVEFDLPIEYGAGCLKSNPEKKLIDKILRISKECIENLR